MHGLTTRAALAGIASAQIVVEAGVEEVVKCQQMVCGDGCAALVASRAVGAAVIDGEVQAKGKSLSPGNDEIAFADCFGRHNLDVGFGSGNALHVFQRLLDIAQVEEIAGFGGESIPGVGTGVAVIGKTDLADATGNNRQGQGAVRQVLRFGQNTRGDVAAGDEGVLKPGHDDVDALAAEAAPAGRVAFDIKGGARPREFATIFEDDLVNRETGGFGLGNAFLGCRFYGRQSNVRPTFLLFSQLPAAFNLALDFLGNFGAGLGLCIGEGAENKGASQQSEKSTRGAGRSRG